MWIDCRLGNSKYRISFLNMVSYNLVYLPDWFGSLKAN